MAHVSNGLSDTSVENGGGNLTRSSSEPELGIVVKSCTNLNQQGVDSTTVESNKLSASFTAGEFRQRAATHEGSSSTLQKLAKLRRQRLRSKRYTGTYIKDQHKNNLQHRQHKAKV